jgi:hypothetical protein
VLGVAAALAVLVIYDVVYVWPLCRRMAAVAERCRLLEQTCADLPSLSSQVALLADRSRADLALIGERLGQSSSRPRSGRTSRPSPAPSMATTLTG